MNAFQSKKLEIVKQFRIHYGKDRPSNWTMRQLRKRKQTESAIEVLPKSAFITKCIEHTDVHNNCKHTGQRQFIIFLLLVPEQIVCMTSQLV